jgi:hypothetical protein
MNWKEWTVSNQVVWITGGLSGIGRAADPAPIIHLYTRQK